MRLVPAQGTKSGKAKYRRKFKPTDGFEVNILLQTTIPNNDNSGADYLRISFGNASKANIIFDTYRNSESENQVMQWCICLV